MKKSWIILAVLGALALVGTVSAFGPITFPYSGTLVVTYVSSDAAYNNEFGILLPISQSLGFIHGNTPALAGTRFTVAGHYASGGSVVVYIRTPESYAYRSDQNGPDGVDHAKVTAMADKSFTVAFEDLYGGGDRDYNDVILNVACTPDKVPVPEFPDIGLPVLLIIGMLGTVFLIKRMKDQ